MKCLFLDDERDPQDVDWVDLGTRKWDVVRSCEQAIEWVLKNGFPDFVAFDHDLGIGFTGYEFAHYLVQHDMEHNSMPEHFEFRVHSKNPVGRQNIESLLMNYLIHKEKERSNANDPN